MSVSITEQKTNDQALKCQVCSGFEEKIDVREQNQQNIDLQEMDAHEIICAISEKLGGSPDSLAMAESIFESSRYLIAEHVLKYEFNDENKLPMILAMWLEEKRSPKKAEPLVSLINAYLKPAK